MPTPVTEIAILPLATSADIDNASSQAGQTWKAILHNVSVQAGFVGGHYGRQLEDYTCIEHLVDWDSIESHQNFMSSPIHETVMKDTESILRGDCPFYHVYLRSSSDSNEVTTISRLLQTEPGITEIDTLHIDPEISSSDASTFEDTWWAFSREVLEKADGFVSVAGGWAVEQLDSKVIKGGKAKGYCLVIGWESVEKHMMFRKTESYKKFSKAEKYVVFSESFHVKLQAQ